MKFAMLFCIIVFGFHCVLPAQQMLHSAVAQGSIDIVAELLKQKDIDVDTIDYFDHKSKYSTKIFHYPMTPLMLALARGGEVTKKKGSDQDYEKIVSLLVQYKAQVTVVANSDDPLLFALSFGTPVMVKTLLDAGANTKASYRWYHDHETVIRNAIDSQNLEKLQLVLDAGADIEGPIILTGRFACDETEMSPLRYLVLEYTSFIRENVVMPGEENKILAMIEELLYRGACIESVHDGKKLHEMIADDMYLRNDVYLHEAISNAEKRKEKDRACKAQEVLTTSSLLIKDLAHIVAEYIATQQN